MDITPSIFDETVNNIVQTKVKFCTVRANTGTGKSTVFPVKLVKSIGKLKKVLVCVPTRIAAKNLRILASENRIKGENVNFPVGYAADSEVVYKNYKNSYIRNVLYGTEEIDPGQDDNLVFCTTGHLENLLYDWIKYLSEDDPVNPRRLDVFDYVIVDEAHLGSMSVDMCIRLLKFMLVSFGNKGVPNVICASAEYNEPKLYDLLKPSPYNVRINYIDIDHLTFEQKIQSIPAQLPEILASIPSGICLIFLPGIKEIRLVQEGLRSSYIGSQIDLHVAHSSESKEAMDQIFRPANPNRWKVILSTNIAETSITIENLSLIIDTMYENIRVVGPNETIYNETVVISKDSANQRAGRTGRTCSGIVVRLISQAAFNKLPKSRKPEIERLPIINELLAVMETNVDIRFIFGDINNGINRSISEEQSKRLDNTIKKLLFLKVIDKCGDYYTVTEKGRFATSLPVGVKTGVLIYDAIERGIPIYPVLVLAITLELSETLFTDFRPFSKFNSKIPLGCFMLPWLEMCKTFGKLNPNPIKFEKFCRENHLRYETMKDIQKRIVSCIGNLTRNDIPVDIFMFDPEEVFIAVKPLLTKIYFTYRIKNSLNENPVYVSTNPRIKHKPLHLTDRFLSYDQYPEQVVSISNVEVRSVSQILIWFPVNYTYSMIKNIIEVIPNVEEDDEVDDDEIDLDTYFNRTYNPVNESKQSNNEDNNEDNNEENDDIGY